VFEAKLKTAIAAQRLPERFKTEPQFVPNPATWLNQRRMDDDPAAHRQTATKRDLFLAELQAPAYSPPEPPRNPAADRYLDWAIALNLDTDGWQDVSRNVRIISDDGRRVVLEASDGMWSYLCDQGIEAALGHVERRPAKREPVSGNRGRLPGKIPSQPIPH
jgi:hypothetical protein